MATLSERLREEYLRLSGRSIDRGCADSGIAANLASEAADALDAMEQALEKAAKMLRLDNYIGPEETLDAFDDTLADIKAALAMVRK